MLQDLFNYIRILNEGDHLQGAIAIGAYEWINFDPLFCLGVDAQSCAYVDKNRISADVG